MLRPNACATHMHTTLLLPNAGATCICTLSCSSQMLVPHAYYAAPLECLRHTHAFYAAPPKCLSHIHMHTTLLLPNAFPTCICTLRCSSPMLVPHAYAHYAAPPKCWCHTHAFYAAPPKCLCHKHRVGHNCIYTPYMTVYSVISLPKTPYTHRIYMVLANPTHAFYAYTRVCIQKSSNLSKFYCCFHFDILPSHNMPAAHLPNAHTLLPLFLLTACEF